MTKKVMRATMKATGMSDEQIEQALAVQEAAMNAFSGISEDVIKESGNEVAEAAKNFTDIDMNSSFEFAEKPSIDKSDQWAIACGADLINLRADIINDLSSGDDDTKDFRIMLAEQWGA